ncbi:MAG: class I SAM-dependent methyltransferase [Planctomycetaceae bacterium]|nr:class I SAM-dependent methyltransferase [Planctomycetaceae bacterium]
MIQAVATSELQDGVSSKLSGLVNSNCPLCNSPKSRFETTIATYQLDKCENCDFVFMNPRCTPEHLEEIYTVRDEEELVELYAKIASASVIAEYQQKLERIEALVPNKGRLLDFACAAGYFFEQAQNRGWDAHGCDIGQWANRAAKERGLKNLHVGMLDEIGFEPESFDVIYAAQVFEHLLSPKVDLANLLRLLKPGGLLYIDVPNYQTLPIMLGRDDFMLNEPPQHINYFTPSTLRQMLQDVGMEKIKLTSDGGLKWENLLGRPITSDIASAYGLGEDSQEDRKHGSPGDDANVVSTRPGLKQSLKSMVKATLIEPVFYNRFRVGMNLAAYSFKPVK